MAHNIQILDNGNACFVETTHNRTIPTAWHGLGTSIPEGLDVPKALEMAHADYVVKSQPVLALNDDMLAKIENGEFINAAMLKQFIVNGVKGNVRNDTSACLGITSDSYGLVSNKEAFEFVEALCNGNANAPVVETCGVLGQGEVSFMSCKFAEPIRLANNGNDIVDMYVVIMNSFNGKGALKVCITPIRVVCNNTLNAALHNNAASFSIRHTSNVANRMNSATATLKHYYDYKASFEETMLALSKVRVNDKQIEDILAKSLMSDKVYKVYKAADSNLNSVDLSTRTKNIMASALDTMQSGIGQEVGERGTALWVYNGLTSFTNNEVNYKSNDKKFMALLSDTGAANVRQQIAFNELAKLIKAA